MSQERAKPITVHKFEKGEFAKELDVLAVEEPLEIRLGFGPENQREQKSLSITMRTPGNDFELCIGFLFTEGIISGMEDIASIDYCTDDNNELSENVVRVEIVPSLKLDWEKFQRHFYTNSSCGVCGKASIESLEIMCSAPVNSALTVNTDYIVALAETMRREQLIFKHTGGLHATSLFDKEGNVVSLREDIGRHNALDKVIGAALFEKKVPLTAYTILLSGRSCFELIQKSVIAGIPIVVSVGAPSSLAVETAEEFGITLVGFSKNERFNVYSHASRIKFS